MEALYLGCLAGGVLFAIVTVLIGDVISHALDGIFDFLSIDFFKPVIIAGAITVFGGAGLLLTRYSSLSAGVNMIISILSAIAVSTLIYFGYVKPMENSENSTSFSIKELIGHLGEVSVSIPADGYGEVMVTIGATNTIHIAASFDKCNVSAGSRVVVVDVIEGILHVSELEERGAVM
ncbi:protease [Paenibacillus sediminis]|uniref:Membrane protein implicated in regulation of membrane protease activity n=1 Tax=Paenibacillus sediminis TaxID=664909 RepID=A0ABS4GY61_9BACL|nr:protease [Paenibacillus sediminis]MBP1935204.1 membrane protein implicated in regulation of membrane protease activity [Paenibacillus sediminis]